VRLVDRAAVDLSLGPLLPCNVVVREADGHSRRGRYPDLMMTFWERRTYAGRGPGRHRVRAALAELAD